MTKLLNRRTLGKGTVIFHEGDAGYQAFIVQKGRVRIVRRTEGGQQGTIGYIEEGGIFGEMALIDPSPRMATAIADELTVVVVIPEVVLKNKFRAADKELAQVAKLMIRMVRSITDQTTIPADEVQALSEMI